jgi:predicted PurR-regulated permease PerM
VPKTDHVPRFVSVILLMLALIAITTTIIVFAIPPLARQTQELVRSAPSVWHGIRIRIESLTLNYPAVREALPRTDEIAGKIGAAAGTGGNILLRSSIGFVGGIASFVLAILLLVFVLANPRPLVAAYLALAPDRYREQAHRTLARLMRQMTAWARGVAINGVITGLSIGVLLWLIGVQPALIFGVFAFLGEFLPNIGAFLVSIPILLVALSLGATKFWLALGVILLVLPNRAEPSGAGRPRQRDAIASGQHFVFYTGDRRIVWVAGSFSRRPGRCAGADRNRRILFATAQTQLRRARSRSRCAGGREKGKTVTADQSCTVL